MASASLTDFTREIVDDHVGDLVGLRVPTERHAGTEAIVERFQVGTGTCKPIKPRLYINGADVQVDGGPVRI